MKRKNKTAGEADNNNIEETQEKKQHKRPKIGDGQGISQRVVITLVVALSVALLSYMGLWILARTVKSRNNHELEQRIEQSSEYVAHIVNSYRADGNMEKAVGEIRTMAYSLSGRIIVVGTDYRVMLDSYDRDTGKYTVDRDILSVMRGDIRSLDSREDSIYRKIIPVINSEGYTDAVALIVAGTDTVDQMGKSADIGVLHLTVIALILGLIAAYFVARQSVRDINRVRTSIEGMKGGSLEQMSTDGMCREMRALTRDINDIFNKSQLLEESRQEFVSNVSHELKTPITSMKVLSESLLTQSDVPAEMYREFMEDIVQEIDREAEIISDLLTLVKTDKGPDSLNKEAVDMDEFMELIIKRLRPLADKRSINLSYESFREIQASVDKVKFTLAISNLIENGIKYNVDGGWIKVSLNADNRNFYIKVADSGVGIPEDCIGHIFERFYRVDKARSRDTGGTGLGLAITKNIIIMHKGTINVYSEPGKGTTFTVRVPLGI